MDIDTRIVSLPPIGVVGTNFHIDFMPQLPKSEGIKAMLLLQTLDNIVVSSRPTDLADIVELPIPRKTKPGTYELNLSYNGELVDSLTVEVVGEEKKDEVIIFEKTLSAYGLSVQAIEKMRSGNIEEAKALTQQAVEKFTEIKALSEAGHCWADFAEELLDRNEALEDVWLALESAESLFGAEPANNADGMMRLSALWSMLKNLQQPKAILEFSVNREQAQSLFNIGEYEFEPGIRIRQVIDTIFQNIRVKPIITIPLQSANPDEIQGLVEFRINRGQHIPTPISGSSIIIPVEGNDQDFQKILALVKRERQARYVRTVDFKPAAVLTPQEHRRWQRALNKFGVDLNTDDDTITVLLPMMTDNDS